ncbi:MAG: hypothetical protein FWF96_05350, partial [Kiritimatiellaeota bacterium]|nr:hypothetical protein [Kiritimatiellota bacterium]
LFTTVPLRKPPEEVAEVDGEADAGGAAQTRAAMPGTVYDDGAEVESDYGGGAGDDGVFYFNID